MEKSFFVGVYFRGEERRRFLRKCHENIFVADPSGPVPEGAVAKVHFHPGCFFEPPRT
ncbi:MAG: hypothetical protein ONB48_13490 [candidate division KSB1 bacterium]|nr:hypothetical protein [candidate division KSB1 bacterium]MDZ7274886.1 hypothetical protein [candidate division KSB1 bacterium]MDZ7286662.1 hypothetical protein [candidate division KSB1 bacterium]MDZ7299175.1 hypothetical protein [candidate division KSB1 bacterium]MDZ7307015.1 hypothetical protein [candidate division KSB1 bacterium]